MTKIRETADFFRSHDNYLILTHRRPDGDTIGSAAALCLGLRQMGKTASIFPNSQFTDKFSALLEGLVADSGESATVVSVDMASENLLPYGAERFAGKIRYAVDHHGSNSLFAQESFVRGESAACGEIILALLDELGVTPDRRIAEAIYVAISTDTGCFQYGNTTADTFRTAARCKELGADTQELNRVLFLTKSIARLKMEAHLTETVEFYAHGKVAVCCLPQKILGDLGATEDDADDISGFARDISGVEIGVMIRDVKDGGKISLRTFGAWDASAICATLGGGGHRAAAGATVPGGVTEAKKAILAALEKSGVAL